MRLTRTLLLFYTVILLSLTGNMAHAWSNGGFSADAANPDYGTHDWIAQHALDWLPQDRKQYITDNLALYLYGTELPDNGSAPDGIGDTWNHHVYYYANSSLQQAHSATRAKAFYEETIVALRTRNWTGAAKSAGIMTHYIDDVTVFGHVMGSGTDWGAEQHHSDYEVYVSQRTNSYSADFNSYLSFDGKLDTLTAYDATLLLARDTTFDNSGKGLTASWMDSHYDWDNPTFRNRSGASLNLAVNTVADVLNTMNQPIEPPNESQPPTIMVSPMVWAFLTVVMAVFIAATVYSRKK